MNLDAYADWVASFMAAVGIVEPALVIGHSFGGGVAIKLAQRRRDLVSYLVLLNAVGGVGRRPVWEWAAGFGRDLWPPWVALDVMEAARADLIPNLVRNPCGLIKAARLAQHADLRREAEELRDVGMPVLVLTSESDSIIPRGAFESLCGAIGSNGRVVSGGHSWLLADPDSFGAALGPLVDLRVTDHRSTRAATRSGSYYNRTSRPTGGPTGRLPTGPAPAQSAAAGGRAPTISSPGGTEGRPAGGGPLD